MIFEPMVVDMTVVEDPVVNLTVEENSQEIEVEVATAIHVVEAEHYHGSYEITPSSTAQVVPIVGLVADDNIVIDPIPNNYGLITWNGSVITVS